MCNTRKAIAKDDNTSTISNSVIITVGFICVNLTIYYQRALAHTRVSLVVSMKNMKLETYFSRYHIEVVVNVGGKIPT